MANKRGGAKTAAGKAASSRNAVTHGITSEMPVIPGIERVEDWERHHDSIMEAIDPQDAVEQSPAGRHAAGQLLHVRAVLQRHRRRGAGRHLHDLCGRRGRRRVGGEP